MNFIAISIQILFVIIFLFLLGFHTLIAFSAKRAQNQSKVPLPAFIKGLMIANLAIILASIVYVILLRP